jgi:Ni/Fe-hydrogenase 1 B-type cytochrome subunit
MTAHVDKRSADDEIADLGTAEHHLQVRQTAIYVYEWPVRLWHWVNAAAILVLAVTGYFIASPLPSLPGEASAHYLMGYIRFAHFTAGFVMAAGMIGRIYWAFAGNVHARQMFVLPFWSCKFWREVLIEAQWYAFLRDYPKKYVGHNPLAQLAMVTIYSVGSIFMIVTGMALYAEGAGKGSMFDMAYDLVIPLTGNSQNLHTIHHLGMWAIIVFVMIHVYAAVREDIMSRQSMISTMVSGWRMFKDDGK